MELTTLLTTLLTTFAIYSPNLCDDVYLNPSGAPITDAVGQTLSRYCQWAGPNVPVWADDICCTIDGDAAECTATARDGSCDVGEPKYCEYGEETALGFVCYQPFPSMCDRGLCVARPPVPEAELAALVACCTSGGACQLVVAGTLPNCQGELLACEHGISNEDGTVDCFE
ncbi:hypothetical protein ENSA5_16190 [Enhygromyxa salina]|uniref:Uncharacterized protein n=1 Tax=Enhygromyxa salina TaxID=215803 RepID=A0A2S9YE94_9BACT|nr:hypothetical protein [Enhygromyxa salina]PRQ03413.1 hypothetical protein ENSA5_16190 [Enhygromyxa salina]